MSNHYVSHRKLKKIKKQPKLIDTENRLRDGGGGREKEQMR